MDAYHSLKVPTIQGHLRGYHIWHAIDCGYTSKKNKWLIRAKWDWDVEVLETFQAGACWSVDGCVEVLR